MKSMWEILEKINENNQKEIDSLDQEITKDSKEKIEVAEQEVIKEKRKQALLNKIDVYERKGDYINAAKMSEQLGLTEKARELYLKQTERFKKYE